LQLDPTALAKAVDAAVIREIHPQDVLFREKTTEEQYYRVGQQAIFHLWQALLARWTLTRRFALPEQILDFGCGYGRVTRYMRAMFPESRIIASDVLNDGVQFCVKQFSAIPHRSAPVITEIELPPSNDLIFAGSVFTHLSAERSTQLLDLLVKSLSPDGLLVFSLQGRKVIANITNGKQHNPLREKTLACLSDYYRSGYGYTDYKTRYYDEPVGYGTSLTHGSWVLDRINERPELTLLSYQERGWNNHQDIVAILRRPL
jgi:SAM-dependent methyltransferase